MTDLFITGTDTGVGKTFISALLAAALERDYWKPIQTGACEGTDRKTVIEWAGIGEDRTHPEAWIFDPPVSPHLAAEMKGVTIDIDAIQRPAARRPLIIEGAGGVLVPINGHALMLDLMRRLGAPVVVAARSSLGTINHTLLTIAAIRNADLNLRGVVMIGDPSPENRRAIEHYGNAPVLGSVPWLKRIDRQELMETFRARFDSKAFL